MKNGTDSEKPSWGQLGSLAGFIIEFLAKILNTTHVDYWLRHKSKLKERLESVFAVGDEYFEVRCEWNNFYKKCLSEDGDFIDVVIPKKPLEGEWRLVFIKSRISLFLASRAVLIKTFSRSYSDQLDEEIVKNSREQFNDYAIWVNNSIVPDSNLLGKRINQVDPNMKVGITLLEMLILCAKWKDETGARLDFKGTIIYCSGSRDKRGFVPALFLHEGMLWFKSCTVNGLMPIAGIKTVVSL